MSVAPLADSNDDSTVSMLETEKVNPATVAIDSMSALEIVQVMNAEDARVALAVEQELPHIARAIEAIAARLRQGGRLIYIGAGTSGRLGILDASECPPTFNLPADLVIGCLAGGQEAIAHASEEVEDSFEAGQADAKRLNIQTRDSVVALTASGRTPYALGAITYANEQAALTIGLACNKSSPLEKLVAVMIAPVVGPEVITGSTRLKAGTAQKMVLNMLSTGTMVLLGKTFGNLMVDVQATNYKLQQRAVKIVQLATGLSKERAMALLEAAHGETKTAIVIGKTHLTPEQAREQYVFQAVKQGDNVAYTIAQQAANELALAVTTVAAQLTFAQQQVPLSLGGGLLLHEADFNHMVLRHITDHITLSQIVRNEQPALNAARALISSSYL